MTYDEQVAAAKAQREIQYGVGNVWATDEVQQVFDVLGFQAPFAIVKRMSDGKRGYVTFDHSPRVYYDFRAAS
jgi:hypothetical protein